MTEELEKQMQGLLDRGPGLSIGTDPEEAESFFSRVEEVSRLISGLKEGTVPVEEVDKSVAWEQRKKAVKEVEDAAAREKEEVEREAKQKRLEEAKEKVQEIQENLKRKEKARAKYAAWVAEQERARGQGKAATDYTAWDLWVPSDDEDEMIRNLTPSGPEFAAMEKDINERHRRMKDQRRIAERLRVEGNEAFKRGQYSVAYQLYASGVEHHKSSAALHANAAMASIKLGCFVQAIDHCDRVLSIQEFLTENMKDPIVSKALHRRAMARRALGHFAEAVADLERALSLDPTNVEVKEQLARARSELEDQRQLRRVTKQAQGTDGAPGMPELRAVEAAVQRVRLARERASGAGATDCSDGAGTAAGADTASPSDGGAGRNRFDPLGGHQKVAKGAKAEPGPSVEKSLAEDLAALAESVGKHEECRLYLREVGGLQELSGALADCTAGVPLVETLRVLHNASLSDFNTEAIQKHGGLDAAVALLAEEGAQAPARGAAADLLYTASTQASVRAHIARVLADRGALPALLSLAKLLGDQRPSPSMLRSLCAMSLALLAQCCVEKPVQAALRAGAGELAGELWGTLRACMGSGVADAVQEQACSAVGNACTDAALLASAAGDEGLVSALVHGLKGATLSGSGSVRAALAALSNLLLDSSALAPAFKSGAVECLSALAVQGDSVVASRALVALSRLCKLPEAAAAMSEARTHRLFLDVFGAALGLDAARAAEAGERWQSNDGAEARQAAEACIRGLALLESIADGVGDDLVEAGAVRALSAALAGPKLSDAAAGNASLLLGALSARRGGVDALRAADAVAALVQAMVQREGAVRKNAAVACARAVQRDERLRERLRELNGVEIMFRYVKP